MRILTSSHALSSPSFLVSVPVCVSAVLSFASLFRQIIRIRFRNFSPLDPELTVVLMQHWMI